MIHVVENDVLIPEIRNVLLEGKDVRFTPLGVSMRPWIEGGRDSVILRHFDRVEVGHMALAYIGPRYVLHRVIKVEGDSVTLMGDGNLRGEEHCTQDDVVGTVIRIDNPDGRRKPLTNGWLWRKLLPIRWILLKFYRKLYLPLAYESH